MKKTLYLLAIFAFFNCSTAQNEPFEGFVNTPKKAIRVCFYNVENLFDTEDDSLVIDEEFLPEAEKGWDEFRYRTKITQIAKNILALGGNKAPAVVGLCEIENRRVLEDLVKHELLQKQEYVIVHYDSPDARGIDVALLYRKEDLRLLDSRPLRLKNPSDSNWKSRDILQTKFYSKNLKDTLFFWVNHWPSRRGGEEASRPLRLLAANRLKASIDSIELLGKNTNFIIMGDLNDGVGDASLVDGLAVKEAQEAKASELVDLMSLLRKDLGTHKYRGEWAYLDHLVISQALLSGTSTLSCDGAQVFRAHWLMEADERYTGSYPFRTYSGPRYLGGYSDHLPIYLDIKKAR
jgi:predicted extracellular nuclease